LEGRRGIEDAYDLHAMVIHFQRVAQPVRLMGKEELEADAINKDGIGLAKILVRAHDQFAGRAHQRGIVHAQHHHNTKVAVRGFGARLALEERYGPFHARHAAHPVNAIVR